MLSPIIVGAYHVWPSPWGMLITVAAAPMWLFVWPLSYWMELQLHTVGVSVFLPPGDWYHPFHRGLPKTWKLPSVRDLYWFVSIVLDICFLYQRCSRDSIPLPLISFGRYSLSTEAHLWCPWCLHRIFRPFLSTDLIAVDCHIVSERRQPTPFVLRSRRKTRCDWNWFRIFVSALPKQSCYLARIVGLPPSTYIGLFPWPPIILPPLSVILFPYCTTFPFIMWATPHFCRPRAIPTAVDSCCTKSSTVSNCSGSLEYTLKSFIKNKWVIDVSSYWLWYPIVWFNLVDEGAIARQKNSGDKAPLEDALSQLYSKLTSFLTVKVVLHRGITYFLL